MKPEKPITRKEMYLDVATGGSTELPSPVTREEKYLAKIAGESVDVPTPVTRYEMLLAAVAGESYTLTPVTRLEIYLAKAAGQDVEIPQPVTREEMYWFDYCGGTPTPPEREYTGAVPVTFVADGTPLIDLLISGNEEHSGTPTPDNPIMPEGTGERTGNLCNQEIIETQAANKVIGRSAGLIQALLQIEPNKNYTCSWDFISQSTTGVRNELRLYAGNTYINVRIINGTSFSISAEALTEFKEATSPQIIAYFGNAGGKMEEFMLVEGSFPLPYEPYGYKIPISSANTTTPVYLGEVETTRKVKKLVLTGEEAWQLWNGNYYSSVIDRKGTISTILCTHFINSSAQGISYNGQSTSGLKIASVAVPFVSSVNDLKAWLAAQYAAGTPVTVWYVLATEETAVVNEPLMKIGDYADTLSMEQAGVQIPTANGSTTLDVETAVKPSEVYIKYRGEAVATLSALPAEVSSPEETPENTNPEETEETENGSEDVSLQHEFEAIE